MILKFRKISNRGFSLLEMTVVLIIATIIASAAIPQLTHGYLVKAANKTALDISAIQEASRAYFVANNAWPIAGGAYATPIAALQAGNFLPSAWNPMNPFGLSAAVPANYVYNVTSNGNLLTVSTTVPTEAQSILQTMLPATTVSGGVLSSSVPIPGGNPQPKYYDSGWFPVNHGGLYTLTHNLNSTNLMVQIWFATDSSGSNMQGVQSQVHVNKSDYGAVIQNVTSTTINISTSNGFVANDNNWPGVTQYSSGYYRVLIKVLY